MSLRRHYPAAREPDTHYFLTVSRGGRSRRFAVSAPLCLAGLIAVPAIGAVYLAATAYLFFRDDVVANLMARQARQQYAYEDRIAALRTQLDKVTSRQLLDQDSLEGRVQSLATRQAQLETRTALVASLATRINGVFDIVGSVAPAAGPAAARAPAAGGKGPAAPMTFAPINAPASDSVGSDKPRPEGFELRPDRKAAAPDEGRYDASSLEPLPNRVASLAQAMNVVERAQIADLGRLKAPAYAAAQKLKAAFAEAGLNPERIAPGKAAQTGGVGGPFIPDSSPFERQLNDVQSAFLSLEGLRRALPYAPLRKPLAGRIEVTSTFGYRADPFLGRAALHSGMDMRAETGARVLATAAGRVTIASWTGGYGNLVEIDHGGGVKTRYGHLSSILVEDGQKVAAGEEVGRAGSTGRSTGPHLHYEVRLNDEATDPARFIRAARLLDAFE